MKNSALINKTQIANLKIIITGCCEFEGGGEFGTRAVDYKNFE